MCCRSSRARHLRISRSPRSVANECFGRFADTRANRRSVQSRESEARPCRRSVRRCGFCVPPVPVVAALTIRVMRRRVAHVSAELVAAWNAPGISRSEDRDGADCCLPPKSACPQRERRHRTGCCQTTHASLRYRRYAWTHDRDGQPHDHQSCVRCASLTSSTERKFTSSIARAPRNSPASSLITALVFLSFITCLLPCPEALAE